MKKGRIIEILNADCKYGIGKRNGLLFHLPKDMAFFRTQTSGHVVAMGENTLLSFPGSKPLKNRTNIVLSMDKTHNHQNVINVHTLPQFFRLIDKVLENEDVYIIGGASIYRQLLPYTNLVYLTKVHADGGAEVFYENLDEKDNFKLVHSEAPIMDGDIEIEFCTYENVSPLPLPMEDIEGKDVELTLFKGPFEAMKYGQKDIEMRLYDEKRRTLDVGDRLHFENRETGERLSRTILGLAPFDSFDTIYASFPKERLGYKKEEEAKPSDMETYYSKDRIAQYGPLAIFLD
ncbi:MAG: dihydrofolate reductase [Bacilli bacterium]|nr:dihydrofolate reductase [Bacilli bacterium]